MASDRGGNPQAATAWPWRGAMPPSVAFGLEEFARAARALDPPAAYRLSLDSGIQYKNVRHALAAPLAVRVRTLRRLLDCMGLRLAAADGGGLLVELDGPDGLAPRRRRAGWSRREAARRAGICVEAVASAESGRGAVGPLVRLCAAQGLAVRVVLPARHDSLASLWRDCAARCLESPAFYRCGRARPPR